MRRVFGYLKKYKLRLIIGTTIKFIGTIMDLVLPWLLAYIVDEVIPNNQDNIKPILFYGVIMIICAIIGFVGNVVANRMASYIARVVTTDLRHDLFVKIENLSAKQMDEVTVPSLISRMTSDTYNVHHMIGMMQRIGTRAPILLIGGIIVTITLDPVLTLILLGLLPFIVIVVLGISKAGIPLFNKVQHAIDELVLVIRENITGIRVIKALSKEEYENGRFEKVNKKVIDFELKSGTMMARLSPLVNIILNVGLVIVIIVGAYRVNNGNILAGKILAFTTYFTIILNAMLSITRIFMIFSKASASASRIDYIMNFKEDLPVDNTLPKVSDEYHIEFRDVDFSYNKKENNLSNINFAIKKGESLGIIGATGSGKSTIIQLLMRFYDVDKGEVLINGKNVKSYDLAVLKRMFGVVLQNDAVFSASIKENICFGRDYSLEEVKNACAIAQAGYIEDLPEKYDTFVSSKGTNISGGQRQRLFIARAIIGKPDILILDDASSALDYKTDALLRKALKENLKETTTIIVTQRISSIKDCNHILVIDDGEEVAYGTHRELLKNVDIYKEIFASQMGGENDEL
ncbi:MAG: ABC transporter ATP-binding protein [Bacilli bacterium]|nr:ABC transporter ATP-binding protein [Bacilli bacterium]